MATTDPATAPPTLPRWAALLRPVLPGQARALGIIHGMDILLEDGIGVMEGGTAAEAIFPVASISKLIVATLTLQCVERGELPSLDVDINDGFLPASCAVRHPSGSGITPRQLLQHVSGLKDDESALEEGSRWRTNGADHDLPLAQYVTERLARAGRGLWTEAEEPGRANYHYSNLGMTVMALVLEHATGKPFGDLARERVFEPLGMMHASFYLRESLASGRPVAVPHSGGRAVGHYGVAEYPAAGLRATVHDLLLFLREFTRPDGGSTILTPESMAVMLPEDFTQGLAWWGRDTWYGVKGGGAWGHGGFMQGVRSHLFLWPEQSLGLVYAHSGEEEYEVMIKDATARLSSLLGCPAGSLRC
jgi:CubicO group peptidase (beta-lactamase class C family)